MSLKVKYNESNIIEVGLDEAGRGPLFGRVYTGAVIWPHDLESPVVNDSKKLTHAKRVAIYKFIMKNAIAASISYSSEKVIDRLDGRGGILEATRRAMHKAIDILSVKPEYIIVDGQPSNFNKYHNIPHSTVIKGDATYISIAAASILAKVEHDQYIIDICDQYPALDVYDLRSNKGYGSKTHTDAIVKYGVSPFHRLSFKRCNTAKRNMAFDWVVRDKKK